MANPLDTLTQMRYRNQAAQKTDPYSMQLELEADALDAAIRALQAAEHFLAAYDATLPAIERAFQISAIHGMPFAGAGYGVELTVLRAIVRPTPRSGRNRRERAS